MDFPRGVRPVGDKLQIRYSVGKRRFEETLDLRPTQSGITRAIRVRADRIQQAKYGAGATETPSATFEVVAQAYLDSADIKPSTRGSYRDSLNIYWAALGGQQVASITPQDLIAIDDATKWPSKKTRLNALIPLRRVFQYAASRGYLYTNPAAGLRGTKQKATTGADPYTAGERDQLLEWLRYNAALNTWAYFHVAFFTGMRTGELIALTWADIKGNAFMVERAYVRRQMTTTKTGRRRRVVALPLTLDLLRSLPRPIKGGPIFTNQYGRPYESGYHLNKIFRKAHKATGVRHREGPYPWRHTYASLALTAGVRPVLIAAQLGHSVQMLHQVYAEYIPADDDAAELMKMEGKPDDGRRISDS